MRLVYLCLACVSAVFLSGCAVSASKLRTQLERVSAVEVGFTERAYSGSDARGDSSWGTALPMVSGGGLIPALVGSAIDAAVGSSQQSEFLAENREALPLIEPVLRKDLAEVIKLEITEFARGHPHLGSNFESSERGAEIKIEIRKFRLVRGVGYLEGEPNMSLEVEAELRILSESGEKLVSRTWTVRSFEQAFPVEILKEDRYPTKMKKQVARELAKKLDELLAASAGLAPVLSKAN
jgi:hypothetical protein